MSINYRDGTRILIRKPEKVQTYCEGYITAYVKLDFKWYKRNQLLTYIDQLKYQEYERNKKKWLQDHNAINFDMIHARFVGVLL